VRDGSRHFLVFLFLVGLTGGSPRADIIVLRNGQELRGRVTIEGEKARIELDIGATLVIDRGEIARTVVETGRREVGEGAAEVSPTLLKRLEERERIHCLLETLLEDDEKNRDEAEKALCEAGPRALPLVREAFARARGQATCCALWRLWAMSAWHPPSRPSCETPRREPSTARRPARWRPSSDRAPSGH